MSLKIKQKIGLIFLVAKALTFMLFIAPLFAREGFETLKKIEAQEYASGKEIITVPKVEYRIEGLSDPFESYLPKKEKNLAVVSRQESEAVKPLPSLAVQGIIWGDVLPVAIINNKVLRVGDVIEGAKVIRIDKEGVELFYDGRVYTLSSPASSGGEKKIKEEK